MIFKETAKTVISKYYCRYKNNQDFFAADSERFSAYVLGDDRKLYDIDNINDFYALCDKYNFTVPDANIEKRFAEHDHFCVIIENDHYGCWGWYADTEKDFYVLEIDRSDRIPENACVLYHYFTNPDYRRNGYYYDLLKSIVSQKKKRYYIIYAYDTNTASRGAISKAGFTNIGIMNHKSFIGFAAMIAAVNNIK